MRSRGRYQTAADSGGNDAFLDVVANLVGILIILITVIGVGMRDAWVEAAIASADVEAVEELPDFETPQQKVVEIEEDIAKMNRDMREISVAALERRGERDEMLLRLEIVRQAMEEQQQYLSDSERATLQLSSELEARKQKLERLGAQKYDLLHQEKAPQVLEHRATPLAQTVFGVEEHFRLLHGNVVYVPLNTMIERLKEEASQNAWKLKNAPAITESLGPVDGFYMKYTLVRSDSAVLTRQGPVQQSVVALERFELVPTSDMLGVPINEALQPGSQLEIRLKGIDPEHTTITVWTYPDSYGNFRALRDWLYARGYRAAARPLPEGQYITGSPRGSRSSAQ